MPEYLYVLGLGPVQGFISAARRTMDLWMGSHLLSEISKAAARTITEPEVNGELIFPALEKNSDELKQSSEPDAFNVANIIRAVISADSGAGIANLNEKIKTAARDEWMLYANAARKELNDHSIAINGTIWEAQVDDVLEFYAAWVPLDGNYDVAQKRLMRIFGSRKALRNFQQTHATWEKEWRVEKSSLDGSRETVLGSDTISSNASKDLRLRLRLNPREELCAIGVTKRLGGEKTPFPSIVRIAIDPWIRGILASGDSTEATLALRSIIPLCENRSFASGSGSRKDPEGKKKKFYEYFPFDGQVFLPSRMEALKEDPLTSEKDREDLLKIEKFIRTIRSLRDGQPRYGEPNPYFAILVADGDRMGKVISNIKDKKKHQEFSQTLAQFSIKARELVEDEEHHGVMVYAGGEDVLAFLPVDTCIDAARKLHSEFGELLNGFTDETGKKATLSVGISIGHCLEPLEDLLNYARAAEKDAKNPDRDGLAIHYHARSGGDPINAREGWIPPTRRGVQGQPIDKRLDLWIRLFVEGRFPDGAAYDLRQLAEDYRGMEDVPSILLVKDVERLLRRKQVGKDKGISEQDLKELLAGVTTYDLLVQRADELILARKIAESTMQAHPAMRINVEVS